MTVTQSDLDKAQTADDILAALAGLQWQADHDGEDCPQDMIPTPKDLNDFRNKMPWEAKTEAGKRLAELVKARPEKWSGHYSTITTDAPIAETLPFSDVQGAETLLLEYGLVLAVSGIRHGPGTGEMSPWCYLPLVETVHQQWAELPDNNRPQHPLAPLVKAWQERAVEVENLDTRDKGIVQESLFGWAGVAPAILTHSRHENELPLRPGRVDTEPAIPFLQGFEPPESQVVTAPALSLIDEAGFGKMTAGSGARMDKRLLVHSLMALPMSERRPGGRYTLRPDLRTMVHGWLMPPPAETGTGKGSLSGWKPSRHSDTLRRAMNAVTLAGIILPDRTEWRPVMFRKLPDFANLDSRAIIEIALPELSDRGPMIDRPGLIAAGVVSDMAFDGALTLATLWDRAKATNGGHRILATRPKALRDANGFLTRTDGSQITGHRNNPFRGRDGKLQWREGNVPQRDWRHPDAVLDGEERHPQADKVPILDRDDRRRLFYGHGSDHLSKSGRSMAAGRADKRLRDLEAQGRIVIEDLGRKGWRILEPAP